MLKTFGDWVWPGEMVIDSMTYSILQAHGKCQESCTVAACILHTLKDQADDREVEESAERERERSLHRLNGVTAGSDSLEGCAKLRSESKWGKHLLDLVVVLFMAG